jgi:hypothetical protein
MADQIIDLDALEQATAGSPKRLRGVAGAFKQMAATLEEEADELDGKSAGKSMPASSGKRGPVGRRRGGSQQVPPEPSGEHRRDGLGRRIVDDSGDGATKGQGADRDVFGRRRIQ